MLMKNYLKVQFIHLSLKAFMMGIVLVGTSLQAMDKQEKEKADLLQEEILRSLKDKKREIVLDIGPSSFERSLMKGNEKDSHSFKDPHFLTYQQQHQDEFFNAMQSMLAPGGKLIYTAWDEKRNTDGTVIWEKGNKKW